MLILPSNLSGTVNYLSHSRWLIKQYLKLGTKWIMVRAVSFWPCSIFNELNTTETIFYKWHYMLMRILQIIKKLVLLSGSLYICRKNKDTRRCWMFRLLHRCRCKVLSGVINRDEHWEETPETCSLERDHQLFIRTFVCCRSLPRVEHGRLTKTYLRMSKFFRSET